MTAIEALQLVCVIVFTVCVLGILRHMRQSFTNNRRRY